MTRVQIFGIGVDSVRVTEAADSVIRMARTQGLCRYVVTPNVDHVLILERHEGLRRAYADAALVVADGWPVVAASRLLGEALPERVAGSRNAVYSSVTALSA